MFAVGDKVSYGINGVCTVTEIRREKIGRETHEYYVLKPVAQSRSTICVPLDNEALVSKMSPLLTPQELQALICELPQIEPNWIENDYERSNEYKRILRGSDRRSIFAVIKALYLQQKRLTAQNRRLKVSDHQIMREAENILYNEFAQILSIEPHEVLPYLSSRVESFTKT